MTWTGRPLMPALHKPTAEDVDDILDQIDSLTAPGWTSYSPTWTATGGGAAIGNGSITGRYRQPSGSDLLLFEIRLLAGTTTTFGTLFWSFTTPVTVSAGSLVSSVGLAAAIDASAGTSYPCVARVFTTTTIVLNGPTGGSVTNLVPFTWANLDELRISMWIEPA